MTKMGIAMTAQQFDTAHAMSVVRPLHNIRFFEFRVEAGPAATCIELAVCIEQRLIAAHGMVLLLVPALLIFGALRRFGPRLLGHPVLVGRQLRFPIIIGLAYFAPSGIVTKSTRPAK